MIKRSFVFMIMLLVGTAFCQLDTIPPQINWTSPSPGETLVRIGPHWSGHDPNFIVSFNDTLPSSGLNSASLLITLAECDSPGTTITGYISFVSFNFGFANCPFDWLGLDTNMCYQLCLSIADNMGNADTECVRFYTSSEVLDTCSPVIASMHPEGMGILCPPDDSIWFIVVDSARSCDYSSGVGDAVAILTVSGGAPETLYVDSGLVRSDIDSITSLFVLDTAYYTLPPDTSVNLVIIAYDVSGNSKISMLMFYTCDTVMVDTCAPVVEWTAPFYGETLVMIDSIWRTTAWDTEFVVIAYDTGGMGCPGSAIDTYSIGVFYTPCDTADTHYIGGLTAVFIETNFVYISGLMDSLELDPGRCYRLCLRVGDVNGNRIISCVLFYTQPPLTPDTCPPVVADWFPPSDTCIPFGFMVDAMICDDMSCSVSPLFPESLIVTLLTASDTTDVTDSVIITPIGSCMRVSYRIGPPHVMPGDTFSLCVHIVDTAGNALDSCNTWFVCRGGGADLCPPIVDWIIPTDGETLIMRRMYWYTRSLDSIFRVSIVDTGCPPTDIDLSSINAYFIKPGVPTHFPVPYRVADHLPGHVLIEMNNTDFILDPGSEYRFCVEASDVRMNHAVGCITVYTISATTIDSCPPELEEWYVTPGDTYCPPSRLGFRISDPYDSVVCTYASGIDVPRITALWHIGGPPTVLNLGVGLFVDSVGPNTYNVWVDPRAVPLVPGGGATLCVRCNDMQVNILDTCMTLYICDSIPSLSDTCPPLLLLNIFDGETLTSDGVRWYNTYGDTILRGRLIDNGCPPTGVDTFSIIARYHLCADTIWFDAPLNIEPLPADSVGISCPFRALSLMPASCYELCFNASDLLWNYGVYCLHFYTSTPPMDTCPPTILFAEPDTMTLCVPPGTTSCSFIFDDRHCPVVTGIDSATLRLDLMLDGVPLVPISARFVHMTDSAASLIVKFYADTSSTLLSVDIHIGDYAGNLSDAHIDWFICSADTCPPVLIYSSVSDSDTISVHSPPRFVLMDPLDSLCPFCSGIDDSAIELSISRGVAFPVLLTPGHGLIVSSYLCSATVVLDTAVFPLRYGETYHAGLRAWDRAGNMLRTPSITFFAELPPDTTPPCIEILEPSPGESVSSMVTVRVKVCDSCDGSWGISGIDLSSLRFSFDGDTSAVSSVTHLYDSTCHGYILYYSVSGLGVDTHTVCLRIADFAGNSSDTCWSFIVAPFVFELISPDSGSVVSCDSLAIVLRFPHGIPPYWSLITVRFPSGSLVVSPVDTAVTEVRGDTLIIEWLSSLIDGLWSVYNDYSRYYFTIDRTPPHIEFVMPRCADTLWDTASYIVAYIVDSNTVYDSSITITIDTFAYTIRSSLVSWSATTGTLRVGLDSIPLVDYRSIRICVSAADMPDTCEPNCDTVCCVFPVGHIIKVVGRVLDQALNPIPGARVIGMRYLMPSDVVFSTFTDASGAYSVELHPRVMTMTLMMAAIDTSGAHRPEFWNDQIYPFDADTISLHPGENTFDFVLETYSTYHFIKGKITDALLGTGLENSLVMALPTDTIRTGRYSFAITDSAGDYSIPVEDSTYYVFAYGDGYVPSYYGGVFHWDSAAVVRVRGSDVEHINIPLRNAPLTPSGSVIHGLTFVVVGDTDTVATRGIIAMLCEPASDSARYASVSAVSGEYQMMGIPPGTYKVEGERVIYIPAYGWETVTLPPAATRDIFLKWAGEAGIKELETKPYSVAVAVFPNPFNRRCAINFELARPLFLRMRIYDISGKLVSEPVNAHLRAGSYVTIWDAGDLPSGAYFVVVNAGEKTIRKVVWLIK